MKIEIDLNEITLAYLKEIANEHKTTESDVVAGLLLKHGLRKLMKKEKHKKKEKKNKHCSFAGETFNLK
jgi:hypothetical protein